VEEKVKRCGAFLDGFKLLTVIIRSLPLEGKVPRYEADEVYVN
jgi:hypothetical protein